MAVAFRGSHQAEQPGVSSQGCQYWDRGTWPLMQSTAGAVCLLTTQCLLVSRSNKVFVVMML